MSDNKKDLEYMKKALELAESVKGTTFPNPAVGAVIVSQDIVVGAGATKKCGDDHAEKTALKNAQKKALGATMYVTLEPCSHHGRTAPCVDMIIDAGIKRVFVAVKDPNPLVSGKGIETLRKAGVEVITGLLSKEATRVNEDFFWDITKKRSWITLKLALTLDGRVADARGKSKWITSADSRDFVQELRRRHAAIGVGLNTLREDNPRLTARCKKTFFPARIVFAPDRNIPQESLFLLNASETRSIVVLRGGKRGIETSPAGVEFWNTGVTDPHESLFSFVEMAHEQHISSLFVEGGQRLASLFMESGLVNRLYFFYGNKIVGSGKDGLLFSHGLDIGNSITLRDAEHRIFGSDMMITGIPEYK
ncbi:riboflavin biosynthesis protein RibD [Chitinispirillum alkaliphilum]|nr:riboflavin biosynthesis protein RibD [Chitinispirillum alkaliphilum]